MTRIDDDAYERVRAYFAGCLARYGNDPRGVDWHDRDAQRARFEALLYLESLDGASILDAGCGLGDLYGYLHERGIPVRYTGCDLSPAHIEAARAIYPAARFEIIDARTLLARERFDYVIACGMLHLRVPRWNRWVWEQVEAMYEGSRRGVAFTLPERGHGHAPILAAVDAREWHKRLERMADTVALRRLDSWGDVVFYLGHGS